MALSYLAGGEEVSAAVENTMVAELDRKLTLLLCDKSPLFFYRDPAGNLTGLDELFGNFFYFLGPRSTPTRWVEAWGLAAVNYDHAKFVASADTATEINPLVGPSRDPERRILNVDPGTLDKFQESLQCHTRQIDGETWWLNPVYYAGPQWAEKEYRYAVAELVFEDWQRGELQPVFEFPAEWNKYSCFRVHNLNTQQLTVQFPGKTIVVPPLACRTVRRHKVGEGSYEWLTSFNYLFEFRSEDPRWMQFPREVAATTPMWRSMAANNVVNLAILYRWIDLFRASIRATRFFFDPQVYWDAYPANADLFGDPANADTWIGDLIHHKGELDLWRFDNHTNTAITTKVSFNGYGTIQGDFALANLNVTTDSDGQLLVTSGSALYIEDLLATGTNVSRARHSKVAVGSVLAPGLKLNTRITFEAGHGFTVTRPVTTQKFGWLDGSVTMHKAAVNLARASATTPLFANRHAVSRLASANPLGSFSNLYGSVSDGRVILTAWGPSVHWTHNIPTGASLAGSNLLPASADFLDVDCDMAAFHNALLPAQPARWIELNGVNLKMRLAYTLTGYGWPTPEAPAFLSPRVERSYAQIDTRALTREHPHIVFGEFGEDFDLATLETERISEARALVAVGAPTPLQGTFAFPAWPEADKLAHYYFTPYLLNRGVVGGTEGSRNYFMPRPAMLLENWNALAAYIKALTGCRPFSLEEFPFKSSEGIFRLSPNLNGFHGSSVCPMDQYANVGAFHSLEYKAWLALNVPIRSRADLPQSYQAARASLEQHIGHIWAGTRTATSSSSSSWSFTGPSSSLNNNGNALQRALAAWGGGGSIADEVYWIKIADAQELARRYGLAFFWRQKATPLRLALHEASYSILSGPSFGPRTDQGGAPGQFMESATIFLGGRSKFAAFHRTTNPSQAEYKRLDGDQATPLTRYDPANAEVDYSQFRTFGASGQNVMADDLLRHYFRHAGQTGSLSVLVQNHAIAPAGTWKGSVRAVHFPAPFIDVAEPKYAGRSIEHYERWVRYGEPALPLAIKPAGEPKVEQLASGNATLLASETGGHEVLLFDDRMLDLS